MKLQIRLEKISFQIIFISHQRRTNQRNIDEENERLGWKVCPYARINITY